MELKGRTKDITGNRYGRLVVKCYVGSKRNLAMWECVCDCGNTTVASGCNLRTGTTKSCGCLIGHRKNPTHKKDNPRLYGVWAAMIRRCNNPESTNYKNYGGRGITVCEDWKVFSNFLNWSVKNGYDKNAEFQQCTLDRINVDGNYCPENCRWVSISEQANNTRSNRKITINGITRTATQWEREKNYPHGTIYNRISKGWSEYDAVMRPMRYRKSKGRNESPS